MGDFLLPSGVTPKTGTLVSFGNSGTITNTNVGGVKHNIDLGPGFVVGITSILVEMNTFAAAGSNSFLFSLNPTVDPTVQMAASQAFWQAGRAAVTSTTTGSYDSKTGYQWLTPVFTVQNFVSQWVNNTGGNISPSVWVYYTIFEVKDAEFLRIAGVSLSRG